MKKAIIPIFFGIVLSCCSKNEEPVIVLPHEQNVIAINSSPHDPVSGKWFYSFPFYSSELTINTNGTFTLYNRGCLGTGHSEGKWIRDGQDIVLTSYDEYQIPDTPQIKTEILQVDSVENEKTLSDTGIQYTAELLLASLKTEVTVTWPDTMKIHLNSQRYRISNGTLIKLTNEGNKEVYKPYGSKVTEQYLNPNALPVHLLKKYTEN